jgi:lipopolysaccharide transport system ATP-binding protein
MTSVLRVEHLSKRYSLGETSGGPTTLRETLTSSWRRNTVRADRPRELWALRDVGFEVARGDVIGLIGRNGAGKSTLLKILSRITEPTSGRAVVRGRVASLLEVGTGFHPDLTGGENVFLNGSMLGMSRADIRSRFDAIVEFAGIEPFIETPVKRYSSGMYMRLAFAVAAHLEPEILLVDEVLAVGDFEFQKKCLGKMEDVSRQGRTILFVSHNLGAISSLCSQTILLRSGQVCEIGPSPAVVERYLDEGASEAASPLCSDAGHGPVRLVEIHVELAGHRAPAAIPVDSPYTVVLSIASEKRLEGVEIDLRVETTHGQAVCTASLQSERPDAVIEAGTTAWAVEFPGEFLAPGVYHLTIGIHRPNVELFGVYRRLLKLVISETGSRYWKYAGVDMGCVLGRFRWNERRAADAAAVAANGGRISAR